jgi:hypothetical protein
VATGTDLLQVAAQLRSLSASLAANGRLADATAAQQAEVDVLRAHTPSAAQLVAYQFELAFALHNLALRLWAENRDPEALAAARQAITAYQQAAATAGANVLLIATELRGLSGSLGARDHLAEAITAAAESVSIHVVHGDSGSLEGALANLAGLYARAPGLRIMRAVLATPDVDLLRSALLEFGRDIHTEAAIRRGADGVARVECYTPNEKLDILRGRGVAVEILSDQTAVSLARRDVVVQGNRFADGTIPLGVGLRI